MLRVRCRKCGVSLAAREDVISEHGKHCWLAPREPLSPSPTAEGTPPPTLASSPAFSLDGDSCQGVNKSKSAIRLRAKVKAVTAFSRHIKTITIDDVVKETGLKHEVLHTMERPEQITSLLQESDLLQVVGRYIHEAASMHSPRQRPKQQDEDEEMHGHATTRSKFRQALADVIGPEPEDKDWRTDEWKLLVEEEAQAEGLSFEELVAKKAEKGVSYRTAEEYLMQDETTSGNLQKRLDAGFSRQQAEAINVVKTIQLNRAIGQAISDGSNRFAALTHAVYNAFAAKASQGAVAPRCFNYLHDANGYGLADMDARWNEITEPDATGFKGMTAFCALRARAGAEWYHPDGMRNKNARDKDYKLIDSTVVCFESTEADRGRILHSMVDVGGAFFLPPLTLLEVVRVQGPGEWEFLPGKRMKQSCITVRPTYLLPVKDSRDGAESSSKFAGDHTFLSYGSTEDAVRGTDDVTASPVLTMEQEWARNDEWKDWTGAKYSAADEWQYVLRTVRDSEQRTEYAGTGLGGRDIGHEGYTVGKFVETINEYVAEKGMQQGIATPPLLTRNEVIAIRLYTGPGYVPLNQFLREISKVGAEWRKKLSRMHQLSYSSTVAHLISGLRKLVRVNDCVDTVYRGIRGELPQSFWLKDSFGDVTATDFSFMSTSVQKDVCESYMNSKQPNVLWEIKCSKETSDGFHNGADVSLLSQFPKEKEVLFPPMTMLQVERTEVAERKMSAISCASVTAPTTASEPAESSPACELPQPRQSRTDSVIEEFLVAHEQSAKHGVEYLRITAVPTFA